AEPESLNRPFGTHPHRLANPALKRRAIFVCPSGTVRAALISIPPGIGHSSAHASRAGGKRRLTSATPKREGHWLSIGVGFLFLILVGCSRDPVAVQNENPASTSPASPAQSATNALAG